jgi:hypothetical protein
MSLYFVYDHSDDGTCRCEPKHHDLAARGGSDAVTWMREYADRLCDGEPLPNSVPLTASEMISALRWIAAELERQR